MTAGTDVGDVPDGRGPGRGFPAFWSAIAVSTIGDGVRMAALPLLAASVSREPKEVAVVSLAGQLPWLLTSLPFGAIADRVDRRHLMWMADTFRAILMTILALLVVHGPPTISSICVIAFLLGVGQTLFDNANDAFLPSLVPRAALTTANGRLASTRIVAIGFVGPPLGVALFTATASAPFLLDAASFLLAAALVGLLVQAQVRVAVTDRPTSSLWSQMGEGLRWMAGQPLLRSIAVLVAAVNFTQAATQAVLVLFAIEKLNLSHGGYGVLLMATGVGGLLGGLTGGLLRRVVPTGGLFAATILITVPVFAIIALTSSPWVAGAMLSLNAFAGVTASVLLQSLRQALVPDRLLARVNSVMLLISVGIALPLGSLGGGIVADAFGLRAPFLVSAVLIAGAGIAVPRVSRAFALVNRDRQQVVGLDEEQSADHVGPHRDAAEVHGREKSGGSTNGR